MGNTIRSLFPPSFTTERHEASVFPVSDLSLNLYTTGRSAGHSEDLRVCSEAVLHKFRYMYLLYFPEAKAFVNQLIHVYAKAAYI